MKQRKIKPAEISSPQGRSPPRSLAGHRTTLDSDALMSMILESLGSFNLETKPMRKNIHMLLTMHIAKWRRIRNWIIPKF